MSVRLMLACAACLLLAMISLGHRSASAGSSPINTGSTSAYGFAPQILNLNGGVLHSSDEYLPAQGESFLLFAGRALDRQDLASLAQVGGRYLGYVREYVYAFEALNTTLRESQQLKALAQRGLAHYHNDLKRGATAFDFSQGNQDSQYPLEVVFWPKATIAEVLEVVPNAEEVFDEAGDSSQIVDRYLAIRRKATQSQIQAIRASSAVSMVRPAFEKATLNSESFALSNATPLVSAPYNLDGSGVRVGVWDGGAVFAHDDFKDRIIYQEPHATISGHATHVTGTIGGSGQGNANARGFAPNAELVLYHFGQVNNDRLSALNRWQQDFDSHSWGTVTTIYGGYDDASPEFDQTARDLLLLGVKASGNSGDDPEVQAGGFDFDSLKPDSTGKNMLVVGNMNDDGTLAATSSRGPTNDGRIKPDIIANGQALLSTEDANAYGVRSGTSMATPSVSGVLALVTQRYKMHHSNARLKPDMARAIMIHSAKDHSMAGPDYLSGWGEVDAQAAVDLVDTDHASGRKHLIRASLSDSETKTFSVEIPVNQSEFRVTTTWLDTVAAGSPVEQLVHDLDLRLIAPDSSIHFPWTLDLANPEQPATQDKRNRLDNIEQVLVANPQAGLWQIEVRGESVGDPDHPIQGFVIASSHPIQHEVRRIDASGSFPITLPDLDPAGLVFSFDASSIPNRLSAIRVGVDVVHTRRGNIEITLESPSSQVITLKAQDNESRDDFFAIFPDTNSQESDLSLFNDQVIAGVWKLRIADIVATSLGEVHDAWIEFDLKPSTDLPPVSQAGADASYYGYQQVTLNGNASNDPESGALSYQWTQSAGPNVNLSNADQAQATFIAPELTHATVLVFSLEVQDPSLQSGTDTVSITILPNTQPQADAGQDLSQDSGDLVRLDASGSNDLDGDDLSFQWVQVSGANVELSTTTGESIELITPVVAVAQELRFRVTVADPHGISSSDEVVIQLSPPAAGAPTISSTGPSAPRAGETMQISGQNMVGASVSLNGVSLNILSASPSLLTVELPSSLPVGMVLEGVVSNANGDFAFLAELSAPANTGGGGTGGGSGGGGCSISESGGSSILWLILCALWAIWGIMGISRVAQ